LPTTALTLTETVSPSAVGSLRRETACAAVGAGVDEVIVDAIRLCVSEALTNATMHAYPDRSGVVEVLIQVEDDEVVLTVRDAGCGLGGAFDHPQGGGGLGLGLIWRLTDGLRVTSESDRGTEVRMAFSRDGDSSAARFLSP
jgi:stage II sporulation protein AB (anti-sigma F factor)